MDSIENHEWIENYTDYEVVLRCVNTLPPWNSDACLRGFQTFNWHDASTTKDELVFAHQNGVIVRFDGAIIAIQFAKKYELMHESLVDLFLVLHGFGWTDAVVYHPAKTMPVLLKDMGAAIAGYMSLDIKPAVVKQHIVSMDVASQFLQKGKAILAAEEDQTIFDELSLTDSQAEVSRLTSVAPQNAFEYQSLDEEEEDDAGPVIQKFDAGPSTYAPSTTSVQAPVMPVASPDGNSMNLENKIASANSLLVQATQKVRQLNEELDVSKLKLETAERTLERLTLENKELIDGLTTANESAMLDRNYSSRIEINLREAQSDYDALKREHDSVLDQHKYAQNEKYKVNLAFEKLTHEYQTLVETATGCKATLSEMTETNVLLLEEKNKLSALLADANKRIVECADENSKINKKLSMLQAQSRDTPQKISVGTCHFAFDFPNVPFGVEDIVAVRHECKVKDVVHFYVGATDQPVRWDVFGEGSVKHPWFIENVVAAMGFSHKEPDIIKSVVKSMKENGGFELRDFIAANENNASIASKLGSLLLCEPGDAFVDLKKVANSESVAHDRFTVRELIVSSKPTLYVVHVDALDSEFVHWVANLLRFVVLAYSRSSTTKSLVTAVSVEGDIAIGEGAFEINTESTPELGAVVEADKTVVLNSFGQPEFTANEGLSDAGNRQNQGGSIDDLGCLPGGVDSKDDAKAMKGLMVELAKLIRRFESV